MIEKVLGEILRRRGWKIAVAESCTGGLIAHRITNVPGSSEYFLGGIVAYSNEAKTKILGVSNDILMRYGAVSSRCAEEMMVGVKNLFGSDVAISTTGIAGPGGGSREKPVGLVYIGISTPYYHNVMRYVLSGSREEIKEKIATRAMQDALEYIKMESEK